jgi:hypothetical protein
MLCGRPRGRDWDGVVKEMTHALLRSGEQAKLEPMGLSHRRGYYPTLSSGVSYGGGQTVGIFCHAVASLA